METLSEPEVYVPYRKHSSGDLQSRLKTRKILGVGETDNGDVHRSKISQVLGHNEHLFVKLPRCYWVWHLGMAMVFTIAGVTHIFAPYTKPDSSPEKETSQPLQMMASLYGSVLLGFAFLLWSFFGTTDKSIARGLMSAIAIAMIAQLFSLLSFAYQNQIWDMQVHQHLIRKFHNRKGRGNFLGLLDPVELGFENLYPTKI
ncbi:Tumor protein p53-inducible protein 11 like protein [Argiope bruennichi]|uniref:Tumor protein p53-inducible protein 11 n=1 Tax=Argiope bruennichi TaxID=94029 RepID=A0A8T0ED88_ARGBR|nr:Tumor protein p53-inducible protein 11 like protein [Argiope bruennichi]